MASSFCANARSARDLLVFRSDARLDALEQQVQLHELAVHVRQLQPHAAELRAFVARLFLH
jgi:hypothetical protein